MQVGCSVEIMHWSRQLSLLWLIVLLLLDREAYGYTAKSASSEGEFIFNLYDYG